MKCMVMLWYLKHMLFQNFGTFYLGIILCMPFLAFLTLIRSQYYMGLTKEKSVFLKIGYKKLQATGG